MSIFHQMALVHADFTIRASHNRRVEVYNDRLDRWEQELLDDLTFPGRKCSSAEMPANQQE